jgi:hypothetical protein
MDRNSCTPHEALVARPSFPGFRAIDFRVVVRVGTFKNFLATSEDRNAVHHLRIFPRGHVLVQSAENVPVRPGAAGAGGCPAFGRPQLVTRKPRGGIAGKQNSRGRQMQAQDKRRKESLTVHRCFVANLIRIAMRPWDRLLSHVVREYSTRGMLRRPRLARRRRR